MPLPLQLLLSAVIIADLAYALRAGVLYGRSGATADLVGLLVASAVAAALGLYLKRFRRRVRAAGDPGEPT